MKGSHLSPFSLLLIPHALIFICIYLLTGVEGVVIDMAKSEVTIKGIVDPQAICNIITKKAKRRANVISPLPLPAAEGEPVPEVVTSQVKLFYFYFLVWERKEKLTKDS